MRRAILALMALLPGLAQALPSLSAEELLQRCESGFTPPPNLAARAACIGYLDAVAATITEHAAFAPDNTQMPDNAVMPGPAQKPALFCIPDEEPTPRLVATLRAHMEKHPQTNNRAAATVAITAFTAAYPCR